MATLQSPKATSGRPAQGIHAGVNAIVADYSLTATLSAGDVIQAVKVPHGARVVDAWYNSSGIGTVALSLGDGVDPDRYCTSANAADVTVQRATAGLGHQYTVSDGANDRFDTVDLTVISAAAGAAAGHVRVCVVYAGDIDDT